MKREPAPGADGVHWAATSKEPLFSASCVADGGEFDLLVIGGGFCGLSIALNAANLGLSVLVLEAGEIGSGASGRNGGVVVPQFTGTYTPDDAHAMFGKARGARLTQLVHDGPSYVFDFIRKHEILCDPEQNGWMQPAHSQRSLARIRRVYESWKAHGYDPEWFDKSAIIERAGSTSYLGGWYGKSGGSINPFALAQGLARVAVSCGVCIKQNEEAISVVERGGMQHVTTQRGEYSARKLAFATNGYAPDLIAGLKASVVPIRMFQVFTRPLTEDEQARTLPARLSFSDLRKSGGFSRYDSENRLLAGGLVFAPGNRAAYGKRHGRRRIADMFPHLKNVEIERYWEGNCALTDSFQPAIQRFRPNVYSVMGFSTRGVVLSQTLGREFAALMAETKTEAEMPVPVQPPQRIFMQPVKEKLLTCLAPALQFKDAMRLS